MIAPGENRSMTAKIKRDLLSESKRFHAALPALLSQYRGKWVLFRDGEVQGVFDDDDEAEREAVARFGHDGACVVAPVVEHGEPPHFSFSFTPTA